MNLFVASDWHCEFGMDIETLIPKDDNAYDVFVMAGDFTTFAHMEADVSELCSLVSKPILYVPGNHEFYGSSIEKTEKLLESLESKYKHLHVLNRKTIRIDEIDFAGCVGWMDMSFGGWFHQVQISDFKQIENWTIENCIAHGLVDRQFLMGLNEHKTNVIITHNGCTEKSMARKYASSPLNSYFINDYRNIIERCKPKTWIHGHTHTAFEYQVGLNTHVYCNPLGYVIMGEESGYDKNKIVGVYK